jgi:hypothetical protein
MSMRCGRCDGEVDERYRFCPWCAAPQRTKLVEHFPAHPLIEQEAVALRVSRYLTDLRHVRLSIWDSKGAVAVVSLEEREAARLAAFVAGERREQGKASVARGLRSSAEALVTELKSAGRR